MEKNQVTKITIPSTNAFDFQIKYTETRQTTHTHEIELHNHNVFEIYINLSGDVSFFVENRLYPVSRGDVILVRPGEQHHCVYRSDTPHKLFWILFDAQENPELVSFFTSRSNENFISPCDSAKSELIDICFSMLEKDLSSVNKIYCFLRLLKILEIAAGESLFEPNQMPKELIRILDYIDEHIAENIRVADIAKELYISQRTIERKFKEFLGLSPTSFIRNKKLYLAANLLDQGESVLTAGANVGYSDNSYFIELFKQYYGMTPYQYKKRYL